MPNPAAPFRKVLAANRGEIAIRIFRACTELGIPTVAIYSEEDRLSLHRYKADEAYPVGAGKGPIGAYLALEEIVALAREKGVSAIHPGYGFLAENADLAAACERAGITFIGPPAAVLRRVGNKLEAKRIADRAGVPRIPSTDGPVATAAEAREAARRIGFPLFLKAARGGGGRGVRRIERPDELAAAFDVARREALAAFGSDALFLERAVPRPRHVEVQILADGRGGVVHLFERDCSIQRRHQKVIEVAPSPSLEPSLRARILDAAVAFARAAGYEGAGTVEFLLDPDGRFYFVEMNPRIQVEHTVTEVVTGIDIVQSQIRIAEGRALGDEEIGIASQGDVAARGIAIQCRITTEDPANRFVPDHGRLSVYRSASGFGIRLDAGSAFAGAVITPFYDSLLVKVTSWGRRLPEAARRMVRALREFRIRGVRTNLPFLENVLTHPDFLRGAFDTTFIEGHPELFRFPERRDRATKALRFLAHASLHGNPAVGSRLSAPPRRDPAAPAAPPGRRPPPGTRQVLEREGPAGLVRWVRRQRRILVTDTTFRDAHQSLLATRMRTLDMLGIADAYARDGAGLFSLEVWGGATFDAAMRFLKEDPWERLERLRARIPNILFQMLLRGSNAVGYTTYPDNVVRAFISEAAACGVDLFRVFDSLNWLPGMTVALEAVRRAGKVAEATICYTGDILDPARRRYDLRYYVRLARELARRGAHLLCIKDMAGLLKPYAAERLVRALRDAVDLPIHLHTHDTTSVQAASVLKAAEAGVAIVDLAQAAMSGLTSQPCLNSVVEALRYRDRDTGLDAAAMNAISDYWEAVRGQYAPFESGLKAGSAEVYEHEMPGGQYTNLLQQAQAMGLAARWGEVRRMYREANRLLGDIVKVTPSSKMVGDLALFMVSNRLDPADVVRRAEKLDFPASVVEFFEGRIGRPPYGFPPRLRRAVLRGRKPVRGRPGALLPAADLPKTALDLERRLARKVPRREVLSYLLYPEVFLEFDRFRRTYGDASAVPTRAFFYGMEVGEEIMMDIEEGKTLIVKLVSVGEPGPDGVRKVHFELNGSPREMAVLPPDGKAAAARRPKADPEDLHEIGATLPGMVTEVFVKAGDTLDKGAQIAVLEAMKMQVHVRAPIDGTAKEILVRKGDVVEAGDLLLRYE